jgi:hypothetical protein
LDAGLDIGVTSNGVGGTWLLDPNNISITTSDSSTSYSAGTYTPSSTTSTISNTELDGYLNAGTNVTITTGGSGGTITVSSPVSWYTSSALTLLASGGGTSDSITVAANGLAPTINAVGGGSLNLTTDGTIALNGGVTLLGGTLTLAASDSVTNSITTAAASGSVTGGAVNVANFVLSTGQWYQNTSAATLPAFTVTNNFSIASGSTYNSAFAAEFLRVVGGDSSSGSPYQLTDIYGVQGVATENLGNYYQLNNNIDATVTKYWNNGAGFTPIGAATPTATYPPTSTPFSGGFNGQGYYVNNLYIYLPTLDHVGFFGYVNTAVSNAIQNLGLTNANITGGFRVGGIAGAIIGSNTNVVLNNDYVTGAVTATIGNAGGVTGNLGLNSASQLAIIDNSYNAATITSAGAAGGIVGNFLGGTVENSYNIGSVNGTNAGGIVGQSCGGCNVGQTVTTSYNSGAVSGTSAGGILGANGGGLGISNSYWDTGTSGQLFQVGGGSSTTGALSTANALLQSSYSGFTFGTSPGSGTWFSINGVTRPLLQTEYSTNITNAHQLQLMSLNLAANYTLNNNIDLTSGMNNLADVWETNQASSSGAGFAPVAQGSNFTGSFNGNNYNITDLYIKNSTYTGLFSSSGNSGTPVIIQNVYFNNANIFSTANSAAIIGTFANYTTVKNVFTTGTVFSSTGQAAGFFGQTDDGSNIDNSANFASVTGASAAGFIGYSRANIMNSYNAGTITGTSSSGTDGGFVSYTNSSHGSTYTDSYDSGAVSAPVGATAGAIYGG